MDSIANITKQRDLAARILKLVDLHPAWADGNFGVAVELAELVIALDEWQTKGGFSPYGCLPRFPARD